MVKIISPNKAVVVNSKLQSLKQPCNFNPSTSMNRKTSQTEQVFKTLLCLTQLRSVGGIGLITHGVYYLAISGMVRCWSDLIILITSHTYCRVMVWWCIIQSLWVLGLVIIQIHHHQDCNNTWLASIAELLILGTLRHIKTSKHTELMFLVPPSDTESSRVEVGDIQYLVVTSSRLIDFYFLSTRLLSTTNTNTRESGTIGQIGQQLDNNLIRCCCG